MFKQDADARGAVRIEWALMLFVIVGPQVVAALLTMFAHGEQAAAQVVGQGHLGRAVAGLATVLPSAVVLLYVLHLRGVPGHHLGLRLDRPVVSLIEGLILAAAAVVLLYLMVLRPTAPVAEADTTFLADPLAALNAEPEGPGGLVIFLGLVGMVLFALANGFFEELLRGYVIRRTADAWGPLWLGAALSIGVFLAYHAYYRGWHLAWLACLAVMWVGYYLWRRDLTAMAVSHIALDLTTFIMNDLARQG